MAAETRYMRSDQQTVNGLLAYILGLAQSASALSTYKQYATCSFQWGVRVWQRASDGTETEVTAGTPVAIVARVAVGAGIQNNTWACPETALAATDAIVARVYVRTGTTWYLQASFITEQLGASKLDSATWTVYYYTSAVAYGAQFRGLFWWGINTVPEPYNSRIANFTWTVAAGGLTVPIAMHHYSHMTKIHRG